MIYYIDFDCTICPGSEALPPQQECIEVLNRLKECNNYIFIYSCRANSQLVEDKDIAIRDMVNYLKYYNIPYDGIIHDKPLFNYYIDDRNIGTPLTNEGMVDWKEIKKLLSK
jgi:hypothetical protein